MKTSSFSVVKSLSASWHFAAASYISWYSELKSRDLFWSTLKDWQSNWVNSLGQFSNFHSVQQTASHRCHKSWKMIGLSRSIFQSLQHPWLAHLLDKMEVEKEITRSESSDVLSCGNRRFTRKSILLSFEGSLRIIDPTWTIFIILIYVYKQLW